MWRPPVLNLTCSLAVGFVTAFRIGARPACASCDSNKIEIQSAFDYPSPVPGPLKFENRSREASPEPNVLGFRLAPQSTAQPFLKWAGGKSQLLKQFETLLPNLVHSYVEPFIGGGAVFFHLKARFPKMRPVLRDNNDEL